ncbi:MAG TPA: Hint domain-containing protein, partial [Pyrinomonadaceae bacterium]|nr:Hint domain-containing protein [Pyrinomonadaceae bacterium]
PNALSVDNLYQLDDAPVVARVQQVFISQLQASPSVQSVFFGGASAPVAPADAGWVDNVAVALVCDSIAGSSLHGFSQAINESASNKYWSTQLAPTSQSAIRASQSLYDWAFPAYCAAGGNSFQDYLSNNPQSWGQQLAAQVSGNSFIVTEILKIIDSDPHWQQKLNLTLYKLNRLDASLVQGVINAWTAALPGKGIMTGLLSFNRVPSSLFQSTYFIQQVNSAIGVQTTTQTSSHSFSQASSGQSRTIVAPSQYGYGLAVASFLKGKPASLGFTSGTAPDNYEYVNGGGGCFVPGTLVQLASGEAIPIEDVREGHEVLGKDGAVGVQTDELVIIELHENIRMYGINGSEPFFSGGHMFWTHEGWKAVSPEMALEENPNLSVGPLKEGDTIYRLKSASPPSYDEVKIESLTTWGRPAGEKLYGLHLHGARSYHADGFLVAMNYPVLTERRLADGFASLSEAERRLLLETLTPVMPLLRKAVGSFIEKPLHRALTQARAAGPDGS